MSKMKINKQFKKRFNITAKGKFKRRMSGSGHLLSHKSGDERRTKRGTIVSAKCDERKMRRILGLRVK